MNAETIPALLPCPFCGGAVHMRRRSGTTGRACRSRYYREHVKCETCGVMGPEGKSPNASVNRWNRVADRSTRPAEPAPEVGVGRDCERCQGNGEIVVDWDKCHRGEGGSKQADHGLADCPDCGGEGKVDVAPEVEEYGYLVVGDDWKKATLEWQHAKELTASIPSTIDPLVRLSTLETERARADAAKGEADELRASLSRVLQDRDEAVRVAVEEERDRLYRKANADYIAAEERGDTIAQEAHAAAAYWLGLNDGKSVDDRTIARRARLRADKRAGEQADA